MTPDQRPRKPWLKPLRDASVGSSLVTLAIVVGVAVLLSVIAVVPRGATSGAHGGVAIDATPGGAVGVAPTLAPDAAGVPAAATTPVPGATTGGAAPGTASTPGSASAGAPATTRPGPAAAQPGATQPTTPGASAPPAPPAGAPPTTSPTPGSGGGASPPPPTPGTSGGQPSPTPTGNAGPQPPAQPQYECAPGRNGGATDVGVAADSIKLAATVVDDGPGASFLAPVRIGMTAVVNKVNRAGGICGRRLDLILRNDSWDAQRGQTFIQNFVEGEQVFALAVVPSSEGLRAADSYIAQQGVPVVGTDGMLIHQYQNPWIWPVATSTISTMHVMAQDAYDRGAREFGIVFDAKYHFGVEGAFAFNQAVKRLTGEDIDGFDPSLKSCIGRFCGIQPQKPSYASEAQSFNSACFNHPSRPTCDFIAVLLEPDTAVAWFREGRPADPVIGLGGAQPLFNRSFAENCKDACNGMWVWTGYIPPIENFASTPAASTYVNDVRVESGSADVTNQFLEGGYVGMSLLVEGLRQTGPNLTRANLAATLDNLTFDSGLSNPLSWSSGDHFANTTARAFEIQYQQSFNGWRATTEFIEDPWPGEDIPAGG